MESKEFTRPGKALNKTQMAQLLGNSVKTIHSDEQGGGGCLSVYGAAALLLGSQKGGE